MMWLITYLVALADDLLHHHAQSVRPIQRVGRVLGQCPLLADLALGWRLGRENLRPMVDHGVADHGRWTARRKAQGDDPTDRCACDQIELLRQRSAARFFDVGEDAGGVEAKKASSR